MTEAQKLFAAFEALDDEMKSLRARALAAEARATQAEGEIEITMVEIVALREDLDATAAERDRMKEALEPFAERCADTFPDDADNSGITVKVKHLRRARAALITQPTETESGGDLK